MDSENATLRLELAGFPVPTMPPYSASDDVRGGNGLMVVIWVFWSLTTIILASRLAAALAFLHRLRPSEYLMIAAHLCATVQDALLTISLRNGLGRHIWFLEPDQIDVALRFNYYTQGWSIAAAGLARISCCVFLLGFVGQYQRHFYPLWGLAILQAVLTIFIIVIIYGFSTNNPSIVLLAVTTYIQCGLGSLTDMYLAVMPVYIFWSMSRPFLQKVGLVALFSCGIVAFGASVAKLCLIQRIGAFDDYTWSIVSLTVWLVLEGCLIIICGSVPMLKPLLRWSGLATSRKARSSSRIRGENDSSTAMTGADVGPTRPPSLHRSWDDDQLEPAG
ncbi:hypothetical protein B0H63DRAFT_522634 [Podospora didyma]|uniref:Rhodopsin domain-containing protein n=1 Tax=Podospora didyma TaxID=330526 RepID=A0AAE0NPG9_9PEZI|nr:hypothetical protein B0H63DRAFT_522634 [Podospora didyma]